MAESSVKVVKEAKQGCTYQIDEVNVKLAKKSLTTSRVQRGAERGRADATSVTGRRQGALDYSVCPSALNARQRHQGLHSSLW
jgi:hypothetical protein